MKLAKGALTALALGVMWMSPASAADIDYTMLFRVKAIKCIHPTANADKATVEIVKEPKTTGEITTARVKVYYEGWLKRQVMESDILVREAGSIRQMRVNVLSDTGNAHAACTLESNWSDF